MNLQDVNKLLGSLWKLITYRIVSFCLYWGSTPGGISIEEELNREVQDEKPQLGYSTFSSRVLAAWLVLWGQISRWVTLRQVMRKARRVVSLILMPGLSLLPDNRPRIPEKVIYSKGCQHRYFFYIQTIVRWVFAVGECSWTWLRFFTCIGLIKCWLATCHTESIGGATTLGELWEERKAEKLSAARNRVSKMRKPHWERYQAPWQNIYKKYELI